MLASKSWLILTTPMPSVHVERLPFNTPDRFDLKHLNTRSQGEVLMHYTQATTQSHRYTPHHVFPVFTPTTANLHLHPTLCHPTIPIRFPYQTSHSLRRIPQRHIPNPKQSPHTHLPTRIFPHLPHMLLQSHLIIINRHKHPSGTPQLIHQFLMDLLC